MTKTEYVEVKIPVKCKVDIPTRPEYRGVLVEDVISIMEYCEKLETLLKGCTQ